MLLAAIITTPILLFFMIFTCCGVRQNKKFKHKHQKLKTEKTTKTKTITTKTDEGTSIAMMTTTKTVSIKAEEDGSKNIDIKVDVDIVTTKNAPLSAESEELMAKETGKTKFLARPPESMEPPDSLMSDMQSEPIEATECMLSDRIPAAPPPTPIGRKSLAPTGLSPRKKEQRKSANRFRRMSR